MFERFYAESQTFRDNIRVLRQFSLSTLLRAFLAEIDALQDSDKPENYDKKETRRLMATNQATDNQQFTQVFSLADADNVALEAGSVPVTVAVQDAAGNDLSKWIDVVQDAQNPLQFTYTRKVNDGTQPQDLAFTAVASAQVGGSPVTFSTEFSFSPGAAAALTAVTTVSPVPPVEASAPLGGEGAANSAAEGAGS